MNKTLFVVLSIISGQIWAQSSPFHGTLKFKINNVRQGGTSQTYGTLSFTHQVSLSTLDQDINKYNDGKPDRVANHFKNRFYQYKDHSAKVIYSTQGRKDVLKDTLFPVVWKLLGETKKIGSFTCKKAKGKISGREYEVWYTPQIPVSTGPWKFYGLPGLILEAKEIGGTIGFEFVSLTINDKNFEKPIRPELRKDQKLWNRKEFLVYYKKVYTVPEERYFTKDDGEGKVVITKSSGLDKWD
ncbi:MAG: GLPGLI family protein [Leadbetterella sp.]